MKKIYKYMQLREDFFLHPMFRATPVDYLNDPFESNVQYEQIERIVNNQNDNLEISFLGVNHNDHDSYFKCNLNNVVEREKLNLKKDIDNLGVVSFTENYDNLLMWSHYANNHKGMVIELHGNTSWLDKKTIKNNDNHGLKFDCGFNYIYEIAKRVTYNSNRPKFDEPSDGVNCFNQNDNILDEYFFQKSSCWIYEQEHRSILPLNLADKIISEKMPNLGHLLNYESQNFFTYKKMEKMDMNIFSMKHIFTMKIMKVLNM